jgi:hypothetical protein
MPCTVSANGSVLLGTSGPAFYEEMPTAQDFYGFLRSWGGLWMWETLELKGNFASVITAIKNGSAIWVTDGSFDRVRAPSISSADWIIYCPKTKQFLRGSFYEISPDSSAFRGELLGLTALHLIAIAMRLHFKIEGHMGSMHCDNERALGMEELFRRRIPPGSKHGDLLRLLRNIKQTLGNTFHYHHIYGHADRTKKWHQMTIVEKLNCLCDCWAKGARTNGAISPRDPSNQLLPRETAAVFIQGIK